MFDTTTKSLSLFKSICGGLRAKSNTRLSSHFTYQADTKAPVDGPTTKLNMFQAINNALDIALKEDDSALIFGEDVGFGGVFRCSLNLQVKRSNCSILNRSMSMCFILFYFRKSMVRIVCSIRHYANRVLWVSVLELQMLAPQL